MGSVDAAVLARLNPDRVPGVKLLGHIAQQDLSRTFSECDVLCLPSIEDGFGLVMAQAMACGLSVIHSSNTGGADLVRPDVDGFEVPIRDADALAARIELLYRERACARAMGEAARENVQAMGGWNDYGDHITAAYQRLVRGAKN